MTICLRVWISEKEEEPMSMDQYLRRSGINDDLSLHFMHGV